MRRKKMAVTAAVRMKREEQSVSTVVGCVLTLYERSPCRMADVETGDSN